MVAVLLASLTFTSCSSDDDNDNKNTNSTELTATETSIKNITQQYLESVVYPTYTNLANETSDLYDLLAAALNNYDNLTQSQIDAICKKFLSARAYWESSEAFLYGPATTFGIDPHIDTWPLDLEGLAVALSNSEQVAQLSGEDGIAYAGAKLGQELLGFHGIEFIIFRDGNPRTVSALKGVETDVAFAKYTVTGKEELTYAVAVAGDLRDRCFQLEVAWRGEDGVSEEHLDRVEEMEYEYSIADDFDGYGENMLNAKVSGSTYSTWQKVLVTIFDGGCSNICNEVANSKMGNAYTGEDVNYIESPYSKNSFTDFYDNIMSIKNSLYGGVNLSSPASNSIMTFLKSDDPTMASELESALSTALSSLQTCIDSKVAFVDNYTASYVGNAIDAINILDEELQEAAKWAASLE